MKSPIHCLFFPMYTRCNIRCRCRNMIQSDNFYMKFLMQESMYQLDTDCRRIRSYSPVLSLLHTKHTFHRCVLEEYCMFHDRNTYKGIPPQYLFFRSRTLRSFQSLLRYMIHPHT